MPCSTKEERGYSSYSFSTLALDGGEWSASHPGCTLPLGKEPQYPLDGKLGWTQSWSWTQRLEEKSFASAGDQTLVIQPVVRHYTD